MLGKGWRRVGVVIRLGVKAGGDHDDATADGD
jgi:hypothetical protein